MADVFISYKAEEFNDAEWVRLTLENNGISCWMAPKSIPGGSDYAAEIPKAIGSAKVFVLILSAKCQGSKWIPRELDNAINANNIKRILPFAIEDCALKDNFKFYLSNVQIYPAYKDRSEAMQLMIREIRSIIGNTDKGDRQTREQTETGQQDRPAVTETGAASSFSAERKPKKAKQKQKTEEDRNKKVSPLVPFFAVIAGIAAVIALAVILVKGNTVVIAGEKFLKSDMSVTLKEKTLTAEDIAKLSDFKNLGSVYLNGCVLPDSDIGALFTAPVYRLDAVKCGLTDAQLAGVDFGSATLNALVLDGNGSLTDLSVIAPLGKYLTNLSFNDCSVTDVSFLSDFTKLEYLGVVGNGITSLEALSGCTALVRLNAGDNELTDLMGLEKCIRLERIYASHNKITSLDGLKNATLLTEVNLSFNEISDISVLAKSKDHLRKLTLTSNKISDLGPLTGAASLKELQVSINSIVDISPVSTLSNLTDFSAFLNYITDISALAECKKLSYISVSFNKIEKVDALVFDGSETNIVLNISYNNIKSLDIPAVDYLRLSVYGNPISDFSGLYKTSGKSLSLSYSDAIDFEALGKTNFDSYLLLSCPLDKQIEVEKALGSSKVTFSDPNEE